MLISKYEYAPVAKALQNDEGSKLDVENDRVATGANERESAFREEDDDEEECRKGIDGVEIAAPESSV